MAAGEQQTRLAKEFGVSAAYVSEKMKGVNQTVKKLTAEVEVVFEKASGLPVPFQEKIFSRARGMALVADELAQAAVYGATISRQMMKHATVYLKFVNPDVPMHHSMPGYDRDAAGAQTEYIGNIVGCVKTAGIAAGLGLDLLRLGASMASDIKPPPLDAAEISSDPLEAARQYRRMMDGA